jgi:hypothetical protein
MAQYVASSKETAKHHTRPQDQAEKGPGDLFLVVCNICMKSRRTSAFARRLCIVYVHEGDSVAGSAG